MPWIIHVSSGLSYACALCAVDTATDRLHNAQRGQTYQKDRSHRRWGSDGRMNHATVFMIAVGLAMDACAVSISYGAAMKILRVRQALRISLAFGAFQAIMPVMGYLAGLSVVRIIENVDHWIAFGLLSFIGCKMIYESFFLEEEDKTMDADNLIALLILSIATSIDALAVGFSLSLLRVDIIEPSIIIGLVTFLVCLAGTAMGAWVGHLFEKKMELAGGLILIAIGVKILLGHLI